MIITIIEIVAICLFAWYVNTYVIGGTDKQLIFIKTISFILLMAIFSIIIVKIVSPKDVNSKSIEMIFGLIKDMTLLITGFLFTKSLEKEK